MKLLFLKSSIGLGVGLFHVAHITAKASNKTINDRMVIRIY